MLVRTASNGIAKYIGRRGSLTSRLNNAKAGRLAEFTEKFSPSTMEYRISFEMDAANGKDCLLQHCNWHAAKYIKAKLSHKDYPCGLRWDLLSYGFGLDR